MRRRPRMRVEGVEALKFGGGAPRRAEAGIRLPGGQATSFLVRDKKGGADTRPTACGPCGAHLRRVLAGCAA